MARDGIPRVGLSPLNGQEDADKEKNDSIPEKDSKSDLETASVREVDNESNYPSFRVLLPAILSLYLAVFLMSLDRTIIGVAIPSISDEFQSFSDIAWYESAFLLSLSTLQLPTGRLYTIFTPKWVFAALVAIFEIGSIICAAAPSSNALIVGRAVAGIGGAGILSGAFIILADLVPLRKRPKYQGFIGGVFGIASVLGPTLGGLFTSKVSWRWCFWINLPFGGVALAIILLILPSAPPAQKVTGTLLQKLKKLDPIGSAFLIPGMICLLFALQLGGVIYPWDDARIISLLVIGPVLLVGFILVQIRIQDEGTIPPRIIKQRSVASGTVVTLGLGSLLVGSAFYLPIWFQAVKGISAKDAGIRLLPYFLGNVFFVIASGIVISKTGYYTPWLIGGSAIIVVGAGLLTTFNPKTSAGEWIGYQIVLGAGVGLSLQQPNIAVQTVLPKKDIPIGITIISFMQLLGGALFVPIAQAILSNTLISRLSSVLRGFNVSTIASTGATNIRSLVSPDQLPTVLAAYNEGIVRIFYCGLGLGGLAFIASLFMEWKDVRKEK